MPIYKSPLILVSMFSAVASATAAPTNTQENAESIHRAALIGTWSPDPVREPGAPSKSTYYDDGTLDFVAYRSEKCDVLLRAKGIWYVEGRELHILLKTSERPDLLPAPLLIVDEVVSIDETSKVLKAKDDGNIQYRVKVNICTGSTGQI